MFCSYSSSFFTAPKISLKWFQSCHRSRALKKSWNGAQKKPAALCGCKISCRFHCSYQILSPFTINLPLLHLKNWNLTCWDWVYFICIKRRENVRWDRIWCKKWKSHKIFHRHGAAVFCWAPSHQFSRAPHLWLWQLWKHLVGSVKKWTAMFSFS